MTVTAAEPTTKKATQQPAGDGAGAAAEGSQGEQAPTRTAANAKAKPTQQRPAERDKQGQNDEFVGIKRDRKGDLVGVQIPLPRPANNDGARTPPSAPGPSTDIPAVRPPSPPALPSAEPVAGSPGPSQTAIDAAIGRAASLSAARAGADAAAGADAEFAKNWKDAPRGEATAALVEQRLVHAEVMVPANERQGIERLTQIRREEVRALFRDHPKMAKVLEDDFNRRFGRAGRGNFDQFTDFVSSQLARQDWVENRVGADRPGNVRVGMLGADAIIARAREIGVRAAQDPQHFSPATGAWLAFVLKEVRRNPNGDLAQTLAGATTANIVRSGVGQMVQQGRIPANASPQQLAQALRDSHEDTSRRLQAAGGPAPMPLPPVVVDTGQSRGSRDQPFISYRDFRVMANEAIRNTMNNHRGGDRVTFAPPNGGTPFTPTRQQMQQYLSSPQAKEYYYYPPRYSEAPSSSSSGPVMGAVGPGAGELEHQRSAERRAQELEAAVYSGAGRRRADQVAELDLRNRKRQADREEGLNRAQAEYDLGDSEGVSEAAAANRAINRHT